MALGASKNDILRLVVHQGMTPALVGVVAGLAIAFGLTKVLASLLYGVKASDPVTFGMVAGILILIALVSTCIPARRAARVDPALALRDDT
jgi:putative ABC transport system permease protein